MGLGLRPFASLVQRRQALLVPLFVLSLIAAVWIASIRIIDIERTTAEHEAREATKNLSGIYAALMIRALDQIDLALGIVRYASEHESPAIALAALQERGLVPSPLFFSIQVIDAHGRLVATNQARVRSTDLSREAYFVTLKQAPASRDDLFSGDIPGDGQSLTFARRITHPDGSFAGVVSLSVSRSYFTSWYDSEQLGVRGFIALTTSEGRVLVSRTGERDYWQDPRARGQNRRVDVTQVDVRVVKNKWDGVDRYFVAETLPRYAFSTAVGLSVDEQMQHFYRSRQGRLTQAWSSTAVLSLLGLQLWWLSRTQAQTRRAQVTYHAASEASRDANLVLVALSDVTGKVEDFKINDVNARTTELYGIPRDQLIGQRLSQVAPHLSQQPVFSTLVSSAQENLCHRDHEWHNPDRRVRAEWLSAQVVPVDEGVVVIVHDISERKRAEEALRSRNAALLSLNEELSKLNAELTHAQHQLLQSEKLASIGLLAAGVAHEINNPVGFVLSNIGTLNHYIQNLFELLDHYRQAEVSIPQPEVLRQLACARDRSEVDYLREDIPNLMKETQEGISRVRKIVQDLKNFSRVDSANDWQKVDVHDGIDSTLNVVQNEIKYRADVVKDYGELPLVECLPSEINQVMLNLLVNASHAMGDKRGCITVRTRVEGGEVRVEVEDNGSGIAPEHLPKLFDPFFTTKPVGKGTGLGLSLSYGIVKKHHGRIEVRSEVQRGTTFTMILPVKQRAAPTEAEADATDGASSAIA